MTRAIPALPGKSATDAVGNKKLLATPSTITPLRNVPVQKLCQFKNVTLAPLNVQNQSGRQFLRLIASSQQQKQQPQTTATASTQRKLTTISGEPAQITKTLASTLNYSKGIMSLSSLKVSQDVSLPTKLFQEDESISPDSSIDEENDLMLTEETIYTTEDSNQNNRDINEIGVICLFAIDLCRFYCSLHRQIIFNCHFHLHTPTHRIIHRNPYHRQFLPYQARIRIRIVSLKWTKC